MTEPIAARQVAARIRSRLGVPWKDGTTDGFAAGSAETAVTGIVTTFAPTLEVLRRAVSSGKNMIVSREPPFWNRNPANNSPLAQNPTYRFKRDFIAERKLVIWRLRDHWDARTPDPQLRALSAALGWDKHAEGAGDTMFRLPETSLRTLAGSLRDRLRIRALRVIGDPEIRVSRAALAHGMFTVPNLQKILQHPVEAVVIGEPIEWEASPYFMDVIASGQKKGLIVLGQQVSEEPGCGAMAAWLKSFLPEIPVEWIPAGEPFARERWS